LALYVVKGYMPISTMENAHTWVVCKIVTKSMFHVV